VSPIISVVMIFFTVFIMMFTMKIRTVNPVSSFFGKYSLDTYMMNLMPILIFRPVFLDFPGRVVKNAVLGRALFVICVFAATIILALIYHRVNELIRNRLFGKNNA
jgi:peptidoglycan/LPS O-acetylase OafA/YrhL